MKTYTLYKGDIILQFDEVKHAYFVNDERVYGVTSATGIIDKSGPLIHWAVNKQCIPFLKDRIKAGKAYDELELNEIFNEAATQHTRRKQSAADIGTLAHAWIESYVKHKINLNTGTIIYPEYEKKPEMPVSKTLQNLINAFLAWEKAHKVIFLTSEKKVYSKRHNYAGTLDIEAVVDKELSIIDIKTSNHIVNEYRFQVAAYMQAQKEELKQPYKAYWILRLGKETRTNNNGEEGVDFEARRYTTTSDYKPDFKAFLGALEVFKRLQELKRNFA